MSQITGKYLMLLGLVIILAGASIYFFSNKLHWLGRLPGDVRVEKENFKFYFPFTTMILLSAILNFVVWLVKKLL